ncbi:hypothetical protein BLOT_009845 [Blomia tropicalis]|nr:hypothetical protein BLOT_009845 [Blomia tropicalis]
MVTAENRAMEKFDHFFNQVLSFLQNDPLPVMDEFTVNLKKGSSKEKSHRLPREPIPVWSGKPYLFPPFWFAILKMN